MTVVKEHRNTMSPANGSLPSRSRPHSHSISVGSINPAHRVTRRKSMSSTAANNVAAMAKNMSGANFEPGTTPSRRVSKPASGFRGPALQNYPGMASSVPNNGGFVSPASFGAGAANAKTSDAGASSAVTDGPPLASMPEHEKGNNKARIRRASEGSRLIKGDSKRTSGSDLRCEKCGKGYKHSSCLTKHLWEHTPEWQYTSKLLISKHQQVQLLEAASVLVAMNQESGDSGKESDNSASPAASASSDILEDGLSSADTTPPPDHAVGSYARSYFGGRSHRFSANSSSAYSQSYQSAVFSDNGHGGHYRQWSNVSDRPTTSGTSVAGSYHEDQNDQADLAAAVGLLSCSYGTPKSGPVALPPDVPPVPPLPAKFLSFGNPGQMSGSTTVTAQQSSIRGNGYGYGRLSKDVDMDDESFADEDEYRTRNRSNTMDEDEEGVFGRMEE